MRLYFIFLLLLLLMPIVMADSCSITNLGNCLPEAFFNYVLSLINTPLEFMLGFVQDLLTEPIDPSVYSEIWAIVIYILSMFYGLLLVYSGFTFIISGYDVAKRESAKEWLKNILIMIFLVQASYFIYVLILDVNSALTTSVFNLIDSNFFLFTMDSLSDIASQIMFGATYLLVLLTTIIILSIRYLILSFGVALFPIALFFYFIEPLKGLGKSLLNFLFINIFMSFIASIILLFGSLLLETSLFTGLKIAVMISSFVLVDILLLYFLLYGLIMGAVSIVLGWKAFAFIKVLKHVANKE